MPSDEFRQQVRDVLSREGSKSTALAGANAIIDGLQSLKTAMLQKDKSAIGRILADLDEDSRCLRNQLYETDNV